MIVCEEIFHVAPESGAAGNRTRDLLIASPAPYTTTTPSQAVTTATIKNSQTSIVG